MSCGMMMMLMGWRLVGSGGCLMLITKVVDVLAAGSMRRLVSVRLQLGGSVVLGVVGMLFEVVTSGCV